MIFAEFEFKMPGSLNRNWCVFKMAGSKKDSMQNIYVCTYFQIANNVSTNNGILAHLL